MHELEQARSEYKRLTEAQRDMLDRLSAGVAQFAADRTLRFSNQPFQRLFALRPEDLVDAPEFDRVLDSMREAGRLPGSRDFRSEEHTSELQSLMRISYAVFCLKKKHKKE